MFFGRVRPDWSKEGADWPHHKASRFVEAGGVRFHVQELGAGPDALLLHGTGASTHSFDALADRLALRFRVIMCDLPGHGFSSAPRASRMSLPAIANSIAALIDSEGRKPALIVGHSAGAAIGVRMVASGAVSPRAFVSIAGALAPFGGPAGFIFPVMAKLLNLNPFAPHFFARGGASRSRVVSLIKGTGSSISDDGVDYYARLLAHPGHIAGALGMMANWDLTRMADDLGSLYMPALFLTGARDKAVPAADAERASRLSPRGRLETLPAVGHLAHEEAPEEVAERILRFAAEAGVVPTASANSAKREAGSSRP